MKIRIFFAALFLLVFFRSANAQVQVTLSGFTNNLLGDLGNVYNPGIGYEGDFRYFIYRKPYSLGAKIGYINQPEKNTEEINLSTFHFAVYGNYYFRKEEVRPYAGLGIGIYGLRVINPFAVINDPKFDQTRNFYPGICPTIGAQYMISDVVGLDMKVNYLYILSKGKATTSLGVFLGLVLQFGVY